MPTTAGTAGVLIQSWARVAGKWAERPRPAHAARRTADGGGPRLRAPGPVRYGGRRRGDGDRGCSDPTRGGRSTRRPGVPWARHHVRAAGDRGARDVLSSGGHGRGARLGVLDGPD